MFAHTDYELVIQGLKYQNFMGDVKIQNEKLAQMAEDIVSYIKSQRRIEMYTLLLTRLELQKEMVEF